MRNLRGSIFGLIGALIVGLAMPAFSQSRGRLNVVEENDLFYNTDRHYTQGLKLSYVTGTLGEETLLNAPIRFLRERTFLFASNETEFDDRVEFTFLGQSIFTPININRRNPDQDDRPYAGWLYGGVTLVQNANDRQLDTLELLVGVVGSYALGRQTQNDFHQLIGQLAAEGWGYQLKNELGLVASWERKWRYSLDLPAKFAIEVIPEAGLTVGNVFTYASVGGMVRVGRGLKANWGPSMIRPGYSGTGYSAADREHVGLGFSAFAGGQGRLMGRNIFLDGNTFANGRNVNKNYAVGDFFVGAELFYGNTARVAATFALRSPEYEDQPNSDAFGSIQAGITF
jgi:lipid A 3-O-deacylase